MTIGERIKTLRIAKGMSQDELAKKVGYKSRSSVNKIELGQREITQSGIMSFAKALGTTPQYIMGWDDMEALIDKYNCTAPALIEKYNGDLDAAYAEQQRIDQGNIGSIMEILSNKDKELLNDYFKLNELGKDKAIDYVKDLTSVEKYTK